MEIIEWFLNNHVDFSKRLEIRKSPLGGTGVFAVADIHPDDVLLSVPKKVILSPKTCAIANILADLDLDPMQALVFAYIFEKKQPNSPWALFIDTVQATPLPDVPRLWPEELREMMKHCDIHFSGGLDSDQIEQGAAECHDFFQELGYTLVREEYTDAVLRVSSRAFEVDNFHELALVPGACLFNHSDVNTVRFETDGSVCFMCGAQSCGCRASESESESEEGAYASDASEASKASGASNASDGSDGSDGSDISVDFENVCEIRAISSIKKGSEIFNTYGDDGNSALLARYGFVIPHNSHEIVDITRDLFQYSKRNNLKDRYAYMKKNFAQFFEEEEDAEWRDALFIDADGELSGPVTLLATVLSLSEKEYKKFQRTGEYKIKSEEPVRKILIKVLETRLENYRDGGLPSSVYFDKAGGLEWPLNAIHQLIGTEKEVVERALEDCKS